jgi:hypothetical protein
LLPQEKRSSFENSGSKFFSIGNLQQACSKALTKSYAELAAKVFAGGEPEMIGQEATSFEINDR